MSKSSPVADGQAEILARLERWLRKHRPEYYRALLLGATEEQLGALERQLGRSLPADLRALLTWHNGQDADAVGCFEQDWRLMGSQQIGEGSKELKQSTGREWIPVFEDDAGNYRCIDPTQAGAPFHEVILGQSDYPQIARSLTEWLQEFATAVERGEYVEDPERGEFIRKSKSH